MRTRQEEAEDNLATALQACTAPGTGLLFSAGVLMRFALAAWRVKHISSQSLGMAQSPAHVFQQVSNWFLEPCAGHDVDGSFDQGVSVRKCPRHTAPQSQLSSAQGLSRNLLMG